MSTQGAVQLQVTVNGHSLSIDKKNLISLQVKRNIGDAANEFTLEAFDETAWQLEEALMGENYAPITVSYSSSNSLNQNKTIVFTGICFNYEVSFVGRATMITITGTLSATDGVSSGWWFDRNSIEWCATTPEKRADGWWIDGKNEAEYEDFENNEDVCAILDFKDGNGNPTDNPIVYFNPSRIFKRIIHKYNGDKLGSSVVTSVTTETANSSQGQLDITKGHGEKINNTSATCWNYLTGTAGYSPYVAAGIMGNIMQECSMDYTAYNNISGGHYGLCQWSKIYYPSMWEASLSKQLEYIKPWINSEYNTYKSNYNVNVDLNDFLAMTDVREIAKAFAVVMERAGSDEIAISSRQNYAEGYLSFYSNVVSTTTTQTAVYSGPLKDWGTGGTGNFKIAPNGVDESRWIANLDTIQLNETAAEYINRVLCKNAVTDTGKPYADETAGFKYYVTAEGHHFKALDYNSGVNAPKIVIEYGTQNAEIISFSMADVGAIAMVGGMTDKNR